MILLYYTGITRLAKNILQEIVRGIFLDPPHEWARFVSFGVSSAGLQITRS